MDIPLSGHLNTNGLLTLKSDATGTASVGQFWASTPITGNVTVERYIPANQQRAWRLLSIPTQTTQTINQAWQEGFTNDVTGINGYGTIITAPTSNAAWLANGFDTAQVAGSMLTYNQSSNTWKAVDNTNGAAGTNPANGSIATTSGYFIYVRGDRTQLVSAGTLPTTATVLRTNGPLYIGDQTPVTVPANQYGLIGNIYASTIDFTGLTLNGGIDNTFYVWDPKLFNQPPSLGAYVTFNEATGWIPVPSDATSPGSYANNTPNTLIQSGQAFFVHATNNDGTLQFTENAKVAGSAMVFRPAAPAGASSKITTNLYNGTALADGNVAVFNPAYSDKVDGNDALKLSNTEENFSLYRDSKHLVIEARQPVATTDTLHFTMWNMKQQQYTLQLSPNNMNTALTGYLEDTYLNTKTPVSLSSATSINFTVSSNTASAAANRFRLVLNNAAPLPVSFTGIEAKTQSNGKATITWQVANQNGIQQYTVQYSTDGIHFTNIGTIAANSNTNYSLADATATAGNNYYRVQATGNAGDISYSSIVTATIGTTTQGITVYPNPAASGSSLSVQFNNLPAGTYTASIFTINGQLLSSSLLNYAGASSPAMLQLPATIAAGTYNLQVTVGKTLYNTDIFIR